MNTFLIALTDIPKNSGSDNGLFCIGAVMLIAFIAMLAIIIMLIKHRNAEDDGEILEQHDYNLDQLRNEAKTVNMRSVFTKTHEKLHALEKSASKRGISDEARKNLKKAIDKYNTASRRYYGIENPDLNSVYMMLLVANIWGDQVHSEINSDTLQEEDAKTAEENAEESTPDNEEENQESDDNDSNNDSDSDGDSSDGGDGGGDGD